MQIYVWICLILFMAGFTKGLSGFGALLLAIPLLVLFLDIKTVVPLVTLVSLFLSFILLIELRHHLSRRNLSPLLIGAIPGIPPGVFFLKRLEEEPILWALGLTLIVYALYSLFFGSLSRNIGQKWAYLFGFVAGCLGGALGASGPAVIVYGSLRDWNKDEAKAVFQGFFLVSGAVVVLFHAINGLTTSSVLRFFVVSVPAIVLGNYLGSLLYGRIEEEHYKKIMFVLLGCMGAFMIYRA